MTKKAIAFAGNALKEVMSAVPGEGLIIVCDDERKKVGWPFAQADLEIGLYTRFINLETASS